MCSCLQELANKFLIETGFPSSSPNTFFFLPLMLQVYWSCWQSSPREVVRKAYIENKAMSWTRKVLQVSKKTALHFYDVLENVILQKSGSGGQQLFTLGECILEKYLDFRKYVLSWVLSLGTWTTFQSEKECLINAGAFLGPWPLLCSFPSVMFNLPLK